MESYLVKLRPKHNNLVVKPFALGEISRGGLLIPQIAKASTPYRYARVIAMGPGRYAADGRLIPVDNKIGEVVAYSKNQGVPFPLDDENGNEEEMLLINESYLLGTIEDLPEQSLITGLDGRLLTMQPGSRARPEVTDMQMDSIARARKDGYIDTAGNTLELMESMDVADAEAD